MRWTVVLAVGLLRTAHADTVRCADAPTADLNIDGLLDDWHGRPVTHAGSSGSGFTVRCDWDGTALALAIDVSDDRVVRVKRGGGHEDRVDIKLDAGGKTVAATIYPGNAVAAAKIATPKKVAAADSLQQDGFSVELLVPGDRIPSLSASTPSLTVQITFHDSDAATGGKDADVSLATTVELSDRKDLLDDFLRTVRLEKSDIKLDTLADLDPDRKGKERLVAGGTVIGVLTDQFAYVSLPAASAADVRSVEIMQLGQPVISAVVRQRGNGGTRDLLMLWTVWSGQLQPLVQIEVRKEMDGKILESGWKLAKGELVVEPKPAVGWTEQTWNEEPADDADSIVPPWDKRGGIAYALSGKSITRRDVKKKR